MRLFENAFHTGINFDNTKTCEFSEENINKAIEKIISFDEEDRRRIEKANCERQVSAIKFSQWLHNQNDVPDNIKDLSDYLTLGVPVPPEMAKKFDAYVGRYNEFLALRERGKK